MSFPGDWPQNQCWYTLTWWSWGKCFCIVSFRSLQLTTSNSAHWRVTDTPRSTEEERQVSTKYTWSCLKYFVFIFNFMPNCSRIEMKRRPFGCEEQHSFTTNQSVLLQTQLINRMNDWRRSVIYIHFQRFSFCL